MAPIPEAFPGSEEAPLVSFNFLDIADATGYETYFGMRADNAEYLTTRESTTYSERIHTATTQTLTTSFVQHVDLNFDVFFNLPRILRGKVFANVPIGLWQNAAGSSQRFNFYIIMKVYHVDASATETLLGSGTSEEFSDIVAANQMTTQMALCKYNQTTRQKFKKGETLRITIEGWYKVAAGTELCNVGIGHDPQNRDDVTYDNAAGTANQAIIGIGSAVGQPTTLQIQVPYIPDI